MMRLRRLLAIGVIGVVAACTGPGAPSVYLPSASPPSMVQAGDFTLEISSPRDRWPAGEPIKVRATLTYRGSGATTIWGAGAGLIAFGVREIGGTREMAAFLTNDAEPHQIGPEPLVVEYRKSAGWDPRDDPNAAFYESFLSDPAFRLPAGRWEVTAWARFATEIGGPYAVDTHAALVRTME